MKNQWMIWFFVAGVVVIVLFTFNYQSSDDVLPLGDVFPEGDLDTEPRIEYEFVQSERSVMTPQERTPAAAPAGSFTQPTTPRSSSQRPVVTPQDLEQKDFAAIPFTIQILSSKNKPQAEVALKKVKDSGYPAYLATKDLGQKGIWHRIYIGAFQTKEEADQYLPKVKNKYPDSFIIRSGK